MSLRRRVIATWLYQQDSGEGGTYAQVRGDSSSERFRDVYRRCVAVFFASARRAVPDAELKLFLNAPWCANATPIARQVTELLNQLGVGSEVVQYTFSPPSTWPPRWRNQFFVFDVLERLAGVGDHHDLLVLLDSDVVWSGDSRTADLWGAIEAAGVVAYDVDYSPEHAINGLTRRELTRLAHEFVPGDHADDECLHYYGGEFLAVRADGAKRIADAARAAWPIALERHTNGASTFAEEAHLLSFLLWQLEITPGEGQRFVKRLWTQPLKSQNVDTDDTRLPLWHTPAEKRYGIRRLYERLAQEGVARWLAAEQQHWQALAARELGLPRNTSSKIAADVTFALVSRLRERRRS